MRKASWLPVLASAGLLFPSPCAAHGLPHEEIQVNAWTTGDQQRPRLALSPDGDVLIVWESEGKDGSETAIAAFYFDHFGQPIQPEFVVNSFPYGAQGSPGAARNGAGEFLVVWHGPGIDGDSTGIGARLLDGAAQLASPEIVVNAWTTGVQSAPAVASFQGGDFVVAWEDGAGADGDGAGIRARLLDSTGAVVGAEIQVNSFTMGDQAEPSVAGDGSGGFVVAWRGAGGGDPSGIFAKRFDGGGSPIGSELAVNTFTTGSQLHPRVGMDAAGSFVIAWSGPGEGDGDGGVFLRRFDPGGQAGAAEILVNAFTTGSQSEPSIGVGAGGEAVIAWREPALDGSGPGVRGQIFDFSGLRMRGAFQVNTWTTGAQASPAVAVDPNGFVVAWDSQDQDGSGLGIFQRPYPPVGICLTGDDDEDEVCQDNDNCPATSNTGQENSVSDLAGDACDVSITMPLPAALLDCADPKTSRPAISWGPGDYDRFKVFLSSSQLFSKRLRVSSGDWKAITSWTPSAKKWRAACALAAAADPNDPVLFIRVQGKDDDLEGKHFLKTSFSAAVPVTVTP